MNTQVGNFSKEPDNVTRLTRHFKENGYYVCGAGKLYPDYSKKGVERDYDEYYRIDTNAVFNINNYIFNNGPEGRFKKWVLDGGPLDVEDDKMVDGYNAKWAVNKLKGEKFEKPFFMAVGIFRPHIDWFVPRKYFEAFDPEKISLANVKEHDLDDIPEYGKELAYCTSDAETLERCGQTHKATAAYLASVNFADAMIGRILDALEESEYADNTIVVLCSDHGWHLGEKEHWRKFTLWEKGTRVPFIFKAPGFDNSGQKSNKPVSLMDIYPTLIDLCKLPINAKNEGQSIVPILENQDATWTRPVVTTYGRGNNSVKNERYNYIQYHDGTRELYDREKDPNEWTNLAHNPQYSDVISKLKSYIPEESALNKPKRDGSTEIEPWHETFSYINDLDIEFMDW
jgi:arylsulfatase A-like enzyme